jgi:hypothetical protein
MVGWPSKVGWLAFFGFDFSVCLRRSRYRDYETVIAMGFEKK